MIQFNLLPDVKMEYVKAKRTKRMIMSGSIFLSVGSLIIVAILFSVVQIAQKKHISDLSADIKAQTVNIKSTENLNQLLTVQNQLNLLPGLHKDKPETSRLFDYVTFVSPANSKLLSLSFDVTTNLIIMQGTADNIATVNKLVDNIKATTYYIDGDQNASKVPSFSQVSTQLSGDNEKATFRVQMTFDKVIFDNTKEIVMSLDSQTYSTKNQGGQQ